jgi:hypothetical protein
MTALMNACPHCGRTNEKIATSIGDNLEVSKRDPKAGDFGICIGCGEWHIFEDDGGRRKPNDAEYETIAANDTFRKIRAAWVATTETIAKAKEAPAKPVPGTQGRALAKGHFDREFAKIMGIVSPAPPGVELALKRVYASAVLDLFEQISRAKNMGLTEGVAYMHALKDEGMKFATGAVIDGPLPKGSVKQ